MHELTEWESFYVIVGAAAGALIGLQFVVLTLIAERPPLRAAEAGAAFATPTIVHFSAVLFLSSLLAAPWKTIAPVAIIWGLTGLVGVAYLATVFANMRKQTTYRPGYEDWVFHIVLPVCAYASLAASAALAPHAIDEALFAVAAAAVALLFVGIHNAWDASAYHVFVRVPRETSE